MTERSDRIATRRDENGLTLTLSGDWTIRTADGLDRTLRAVEGAGGRAAIDLSGIERMDTTGAWLIERTKRALQDGGMQVELRGASGDHTILLDRIETLCTEPVEHLPPSSGLARFLNRVGRGTIDAMIEARDLLNFLGITTVATWRSIAHPGRIRFVSLVSHLERVGLNAMPIVGLLAFLIGVVMAYQGADQLRAFGAEIYTVNLLGISILREMGILMTAIMIAGRSGSAFTAQIGTMQVNEEIDAMRTIGLDPIEVLVLPRAYALFIALPLLTVYADFMGLLGGATMSILILDITLQQYIERIREVVPIWAFWVGLIKAPVFGFVIALVGCREGLKVRGSADSVGRQTTKSVVVSIFLVMALDAIFSIFFSAVGV